jgi:hypothetical protein
MKSRQPPWFALVLLEHCVPDNDALIGDVLEEWPTRSNAWLWRQALSAVLAQGVLGMRTKPRLTAERLLITTAMLAVLGFYTVVVATLVNRVIVLSGGWLPHTGRYQDLQLYFTVPAFAGAVLMGRVIGSLHQAHRVMCALGCSATATVAACLNIYLFVPQALSQPLVPHAATQIALGMVFIAGLFVGIGPLCGSLREFRPRSPAQRS